jgi:filamin
VDAAKTISSTSTASGPGIQPEGVYIEEDAPFVIQARNRIGNPVDKGGEKFEVKVTGPNYEPKSAVSDKNDGTYPSHYQPLLVGEHTVSITLHGEHIQNSPFHVNVSRNPESIDPTKVKAFGSGLEEGNTAEPSVFTVQTYNGKGEPLKTGGHRLGVEVLDPTGKPLLTKFSDNGDGTYSGEYQPNDIGDHKVTISLGQALESAPADQIANSPFIVPVIPGTDPSKCLVFGPGLGVEEVVYDTIPTWFKIQAKDKYGKDIPTGGDPFEVTAEDEDGKDVPVEIKDNNDGTYLCNYAPVNSGRHKIQAKLRGKPVGGSPYTVNVNKGATEASFVEKYTFTIRTKTKDGQLKNAGGDKFEVNVTSPSGSAVPVEIQDLQNGSHVVSYSVTFEGEYVVNVKINGRHIKGSPWRQVHFDATD